MQPFGPNHVPVSRIALGCMGLAGTWNPAEVGPENRRRAIAAFEAALEAGITFYDHADIYGGTACESIFKDCLAAVPGSREKIFIATKVGIRRGYYEHDPAYIRQSVQGSLDRLGIDVIDCYQLHRPDPLSHPAQTAEVLDALIEEGLIKSVGISNYYPQQTLALQKYLKAPIVSNQIAISLLRLQPIYEGTEGQGGDGVLDQCLEMAITPLAYSPIGGGWLSGKRGRFPSTTRTIPKSNGRLPPCANLAPPTTTRLRPNSRLRGCWPIPRKSSRSSAPTTRRISKRWRKREASPCPAPTGTNSGLRREVPTFRENYRRAVKRPV